MGQEPRRQGLHVSVTPMAWRESIERRGDFGEEIDLTVGLNRQEILGVKSRNLRFISAEDYPYETALVDIVSGWGAKLRKPAAIIVVSQLTAAMLVIPTTTEPDWRIRRRHDRLRGIDDQFLEVPPRRLLPLVALVR